MNTAPMTSITLTRCLLLLGCLAPSPSVLGEGILSGNFESGGVTYPLVSRALEADGIDLNH